MNNMMARQMAHDRYMAARSQDPTLSPLGEDQAQAVGPTMRRLLDSDRQEAGGDLLHTLYCSPMWRAMQTAQPIARALAVAPEVHMGIFENGGIFMRQPDGTSIGHPGADRAETLATFPDYTLPDAITDTGWWRGAEEDIADCYARAIRVAHELKQQTQAAHKAGERQRMVMVSHGTYMDALIKAIFGQLPTRSVFYYHNNTGITCIDFNESNVALRFLNRTDHLTVPGTITH